MTHTQLSWPVMCPSQSWQLPPGTEVAGEGAARVPHRLPPPRPTMDKASAAWTQPRGPREMKFIQAVLDNGF